LICYEDTDPTLARALRGNGAEFLVNISNDAWFKTSGELEQHFVAAQFRAIENRVGIVRAGNNGITGIIGPSGSVDQLLFQEKDGRHVTKDITGTLIGRVRTTPLRSLYTAWGDTPLLIGSIAALLYAAVQGAFRQSP
jgi:apolipoprotein N-acyltransferase